MAAAATADQPQVTFVAHCGTPGRRRSTAAAAAAEEQPTFCIRCSSEVDGEEEFFVPGAHLCASSEWFRRMMASSFAFKEHVTHTVDLQLFRPAVVETVLRYIMHDSMYNPHRQNGDAPTRQPRLVFHFPLDPGLVTEVLVAAHYLEIAPLVEFAVKMLANNVEAIQSLEGIPMDIVQQIYAQLTPYQLCALEKTNAHVKELDTSSFWEKHYKEISKSYEATSFMIQSLSWNRFYVNCPGEFRLQQMGDGSTWKQRYLHAAGELKFLQASSQYSTPEAKQDYLEFIHLCGYAMASMSQVLTPEMTSASLHPLINVTSLDLVLSSKQLPELCQALANRKYPMLECLSLHWCRGVTNLLPVVELVRGPSPPLGISVLDLPDNDITDEMLLPLCEALCTNTRLTHLGLSGNPIELDWVDRLPKQLCLLDVGHTAIMQPVQMAACKSLVHVIIDHVKESSVWTPFFEFIGSSACMWVSLYVPYCRFTESDAMAMAQCLAHNSSLVLLNLSHTVISDDAANALFTSLETNDTLTSLDISYCKAWTFRNQQPRVLRSAVKLWSVDLTANGIRFVRKQQLNQGKDSSRQMLATLNLALTLPWYAVTL
eukprot:TRINITY_DN1518_c0_g1_i7.p1 TRINITY_DN1518_c0_g1~~TRINITY_DN1518_c0_g1_i7.p1  ORF type:complete len:675 (-),score=152.09 TRINITY_DN1518_c0_g1_i7:267-2066(-)